MDSAFAEELAALDEEEQQEWRERSAGEFDYESLREELSNKYRVRFFLILRKHNKPSTFTESFANIGTP